MNQDFPDIINRLHLVLKNNIVKTIIILAIFVAVKYLTGNIFLSFTVVPILAFVLFLWDARVYLAIGLLFLAGTPVAVIIGKEKLSENLADYAFYMLAIGIIVMVINAVVSKYRPGRTAEQSAKAPVGADNDTTLTSGQKKKFISIAILGLAVITAAVAILIS